MTISLEGDKERFRAKDKELEIDKLFRALVKLEGSDLHLKVGQPPKLRLFGQLKDTTGELLMTIILIFMPISDSSGSLLSTQRMA